LIWVKRNPEKVKEFYRGTLPIYSNIAKIYKEAGADIITFREEGTSTDNLAPIQFEQFVKPYLSDLIKSVKPPRILHMCGSTLLIMDKLITCNANAITIDERAPVKKAKEIIENIIPGYPIGGNINSYSVIAKGPVEKIKDTVKNVIEDGVDMVAPGCDIYLDTPTEFVKAFVDATIEYSPLKGV
jgi:[methyl-Co(III) methanol-specific corrinoid protein]:coenzyme M methyltransferase